MKLYPVFLLRDDCCSFSWTDIVTGRRHNVLDEDSRDHHLIVRYRPAASVTEKQPSVLSGGSSIHLHTRADGPDVHALHGTVSLGHRRISNC